MKCIICRQGETQEGYETVNLNRGETSIIIKKVPAQICKNSGEYYLSEEISEQVLKLAEKVIDCNAEVEVLHFAS